LLLKPKHECQTFFFDKVMVVLNIFIQSIAVPKAYLPNIHQSILGC